MSIIAQDRRRLCLKWRTKYTIGIVVPVFIVLQLWCSAITFHFPYIGIEVKLNAEQEWEIAGLGSESAVGSDLDIQNGDIVRQVDGKPASDHPSVQRWQSLEQAQSVLIDREGQEYTIYMNQSSNTIYDVIPMVEELVCLFMAVLLFAKMHRSPSARLLAAVFLTMAVIYMSLGASVRGDWLGKLLITSFIMALPVIFLHFLMVFFKEKSEIALSPRILKYLYAIVAVALVLRSLPFYPSTFHRFENLITYLFFIIGFLINIAVLTYMYGKFRKQQSYSASMMKSVWLSLAVSFLPIICFSFLPEIITGQPIIEAWYTSWIILLFPISFAYLLASNQLYDIGRVIRRFLFAALLSIVPVSLFTGAYAFLFRGDVNENQLLFIFIGAIILVSAMLYGAEYMTTRLEPFLFPRKYILQSALQKIAKNLGAISSFRELKDIILVDIVSTLQVNGAAVVLQYPDEIEIIGEGEIDRSEIEHSMQASTLIQHPNYTCIEMSRHEEYTGYLIITRKKTNMLLAKEELQWLYLITSYLGGQSRKCPFDSQAHDQAAAIGL